MSHRQGKWVQLMCHSEPSAAKPKNLSKERPAAMGQDLMAGPVAPRDPSAPSAIWRTSLRGQGDILLFRPCGVMHLLGARPGTSSGHGGKAECPLLSALAWLVVVCGVFGLASCAKDVPKETGDAKFEIAKEYKRGPVELSVKVSKKEITIADRITLLLSAVAKEDYEVELPKFGDKLEQFGIVDYRRPQPRLIDDGRVHTEKSYVLEPFLSGDYKIPPMKIVFWKKGEAKPKKHELETEEMTVKVTSILPEKQAELTIKEIAGPVELPRPRRGALYATIAGGVTVVGGAIALVVWLRRRRRKVAAAPKVAAHELAYRRLEALLAEQLIEGGEVKLFYTRLSDILRHYIEDRFGLHAPERTTEEFLAELRGSDALDERFRPLLETFLTHCDLVKFAEHRPANAEIEATFDACKQFIEATRADGKTVEVAEEAA